MGKTHWSITFLMTHQFLVSAVRLHRCVGVIDHAVVAP